MFFVQEQRVFQTRAARLKMATKHDIDEPQQFGKGTISLFSLCKLPSNFSFHAALTAFKDSQVDALFEEQPTERKKIKIETVAEHVKSVDHELSASLNRSMLTMRRSHEEAERLVDEWFKTWRAHGKAGNVGLVPLPVQHTFPLNESTVQDEDLRAFLVHFYEFAQASQARQGLRP